MDCKMPVQQNTMLKVLDIVSRFCGSTNNFVSESTLLHAIPEWYGEKKFILASLVQGNQLDCYVPLMEQMACGGDCCGCCNGASGGGCCGCGRYYRVKIG